MSPPAAVMARRLFGALHMNLAGKMDQQKPQNSIEEGTQLEETELRKVAPIRIVDMDHVRPSVLGARRWIDMQRCQERFLLRLLMNS